MKHIGCTEDKYVLECKYNNKIGRIENEAVIKEWIEKTKIVDLDQYNEKLSKELFDNIIRDDDIYDRNQMRHECVDHYVQLE